MLDNKPKPNLVNYRRLAVAAIFGFVFCLAGPTTIVSAQQSLHSPPVHIPPNPGATSRDRMARMASQMEYSQRQERRALQQAVVSARKRQAKADGRHGTLFKRQLATAVPPQRKGPGLQQKLSGFLGNRKEPTPVSVRPSSRPSAITPAPLPFEPTPAQKLAKPVKRRSVLESSADSGSRKLAKSPVLKGTRVEHVEPVQFEVGEQDDAGVGFASSAAELPTRIEPPAWDASPELPAPRQAMLYDEFGRPISVLENHSVNNAPKSSATGDHPTNAIRSRKGVRPMQSASFRNRLRNVRSQNSAVPSNTMLSVGPTTPNGMSQDDDDELQDMDDELGNRFNEMSCEEARNTLLGASIRNIALDISPPRVGTPTAGTLSRTWTDPNGRVLGTGTMVNLSRGYVIISNTDGTQKIPVSRLGDADLAALAEFWNIPTQCTLGPQQFQPRCWTPQTFTWKASGLCHKPLYFQNVQLERYGHSSGPFSQPIYSAVHFFGSLATLPYQMAIHPPNECRYALGYYRPGNCAPWLRDPIPISLSGMRRQALVSTGLAFLP